MLIAAMCNQPERLGEALAPLGLVAPSPPGPWAMAWVHGGEILVARTPRPTAEPIDLGAAIAEPASDCVLATALGAAHPGEPDDVPPFRFRRWMLAEDPTVVVPSERFSELTAHVPEFLRRNLRGRTTAELTLHTVLALLHDQGRADDLTLRVEALGRVLVEATALVAAALRRAGLEPSHGTVAASNSRALAIVSAQPLAVYGLRVDNDRGQPDPSFRGTLIIGGGPAEVASGDAIPERIGAGSVVTVSRDLHVDIAPLATP
ncbi:MAG: hypothetical protein R3B06_18195 [Kofleriaceae bacterium]